MSAGIPGEYVAVGQGAIEPATERVSDTYPGSVGPIIYDTIAHKRYSLGSLTGTTGADQLPAPSVPLIADVSRTGDRVRFAARDLSGNLTTWELQAAGIAPPETIPKTPLPTLLIPTAVLVGYAAYIRRTCRMSRESPGRLQ